MGMIAPEIPGFGLIELRHCVLDFSGTLSVDGRLIDGVPERLARLAELVEVHMLTSDTHGRARQALDGVPGTLHVLVGERHELQKQQYVVRLGASGVVAIGNGNNDVSMLQAARLGIAVCETEGCSVAALNAATVFARSALDALDLLLHPKRLTATLRR
jgi:P-type E1-E2 ATPase